MGFTLAFGLSGAIPETAKAAWGCRAIAEHGTVDVLWDRQDFQGEPDAKAALKTWLNDEGAFKGFRERAERLLREHVIRGDHAEQHTLYEDDKGIVVGNTNESYGYLYVAAWLKA
jgi:hypothetical protein